MVVGTLDSAKQKDLPQEAVAGVGDLDTALSLMVTLNNLGPNGATIEDPAVAAVKKATGMTQGTVAVGEAVPIEAEGMVGVEDNQVVEAEGNETSEVDDITVLRVMDRMMVVAEGRRALGVGSLALLVVTAFSVRAAKDRSRVVVGADVDGMVGIEEPHRTRIMGEEIPAEVMWTKRRTGIECSTVKRARVSLVGRRRKRRRRVRSRRKRRGRKKGGRKRLTLRAHLTMMCGDLVFILACSHRAAIRLRPLSSAIHFSSPMSVPDSR